MACQTLHLPWQPSRYAIAPLSAARRIDDLQGARPAAYLWTAHVLCMNMDLAFKFH